MQTNKLQEDLLKDALAKLVKKQNKLNNDFFKNKVTAKEKILLVDAMNLVIRNFVTNPNANENGDHIGLLYGSLASLRKLIEDTLPDRVFIVWDGPGGNQRRRVIFPGYKAGRKPGGINSVFPHASPEECFRSLKSQIQMFKEYLEILPFNEIIIEGLEADDIIAYIATKMINKENQEVIIASTDKDYIQLLNENVTIYNPMKQKWYSEKEAKEDYTENISPKNFVLARCIDGDGSDAIPGIRGIGIKTSVKLFPLLIEDKKHTIDDLIEASKNNGTGKYRTVLENKELLERNYKLMQLEDVDISADAARRIKEHYDSSSHAYISGKLYSLLARDGMYQWIKGIDRFNDTFSRLHGKSLKRNVLLEKEKK